MVLGAERVNVDHLRVMQIDLGNGVIALQGHPGETGVCRYVQAFRVCVLSNGDFGIRPVKTGTGGNQVVLLWIETAETRSAGCGTSPDGSHPSPQA